MGVGGNTENSFAPGVITIFLLDQIIRRGANIFGK